jgi:hypothetical protein
MRFSLATLVAAVFAMALALAALRYASPLWSSAVFSLTLGVLLVALVSTLFGQGPARAFSGGFAVFGWAYACVAFGPWFADRAPPLITVPILTRAFEWLAPHPVRVGDNVLVLWGSSWWPCTVLDIKNGQYFIHYDGYNSTSDEWVTTPRIKQHDPRSFVQIGHSLCAITVGLLGGTLAVAVGAPRQRRFRRDPSQSPPSALDAEAAQPSRPAIGSPW